MFVTYHNVVSPRCDRKLLEQVTYDPFKVMPTAFPARPHLFVSARQLELVRRSIAKGGWRQIAWQRLLDAAADKENLSRHKLSDSSTTVEKWDMLRLAKYNALACAINPDTKQQDLALRALRQVATYCLRQPTEPLKKLFTQSDLDESRAVAAAAIAYDLLASQGLSDRDDKLFRDMLRTTYNASNACNHYTCGNFNSWSQYGRLAVALSLEDMQGIHDALYGCSGGAEWRYGLIHQFRHDFLADGHHWERTPGYHFYTLMAFVNILDNLNNSGCDLWHYPFPTLRQDDLKDNHRAYGPAGKRTMQAAFDAPFRIAFGNCDLSLLSDSGLANLRGTWIWGILYNKAYQAYHQPHYAWLLNKMERDYTKRDIPGLPMPLQSRHGIIDFARIREESYPDGKFSFGGTGIVGVNNTLQRSSTLMPSFGGAVLRASSGPKAAAAYLYYGPHAAGHQHPAALHVDIHIGGSRLTDAARLGGYNDNRYLTWGRTTIAANTVTVDGKSMFPYDFPTKSIWECDRWRDNISDGELRLFQTEKEFSAVQAINTNVYPDVILERTLIVNKLGVLDIYRVTATKARQFDYTFHAVGAVTPPDASRPIRLSNENGYQHLSNSRVWSAKTSAHFTWIAEAGVTAQSVFVAQPSGTMIVAEDPLIKEGHCSYGELSVVTSRTSLIQRVKAPKAIFASFWSTGTTPITLKRDKNGAGGELRFTVTHGQTTNSWAIPANGNIKLI